MISLKDCVHGHIYKGTGRNFDVGWYNSENNCFTGIREKWEDRFLSEELHYEVGVPHGTFKPEEEIYGYFNRGSNEDSPEYYRYLFAKLKELGREVLTVEDKISLMEYHFLNDKFGCAGEFIKERLAEHSSDGLIMIVAMAKLKLEGKL